MCLVVETLISLGYGVMVTQQILVLFFLVRIRVAQQINEEFDVSDSFFLYVTNAILLILTAQLLFLGI